MNLRTCRDCREPFTDSSNYGICNVCLVLREARLKEDVQRQREQVERVRLAQIAHRSHRDESA